MYKRRDYLTAEPRFVVIREGDEESVGLFPLFWIFTGKESVVVDDVVGGDRVLVGLGHVGCVSAVSLRIENLFP